ncbi:cytochrome P450 [Calothrix parasitica NIES-267]|uniref:Cytochrome P450 n=1 Tax=Calothrix parasitica NIES-267 TaxID=1973488 RepID=A0A1Z4LT58_9CYAN|nr:cytochrome P450 [Calothrix parasitica NIES-267]
MKLPEGPKTSAFFQNLQFAADPLGFMDNIAKEYGDIVTLDLGHLPTVLVSNPEGIKQIFTKAKEITSPGELQKMVAPLIGNNGLLLLDGSRHKHLRKMVMPAFHTHRIKGYGQKICKITQRVMDEQVIGKSFASFPTIQNITLQVLMEVWFGLDRGEDNCELQQAITNLLNSARTPLWEICASIPSLQRDLGNWSPWGSFLNQKRKLDQLLYDEIHQRRKQTELCPDNLLSELILACDETGEPLTDETIRDLFVTLLLGGRDAAATAITWALYWIHNLSTVREQLLVEIDSLGQSPDPMDISGLPYLNAVCNESLRLYPTQVVTLPRRVESTMELMGYQLNPGTVLRACIYLTHQREDLYSEPKKFKPERFLEKQFSSYEFLPFGGGARRCIGEVLAMFEMKLVLATILFHYQLAIDNAKAVKPQRKGANFPPANLKMIMLGQRQNLSQSPQFVTSSV